MLEELQDEFCEKMIASVKKSLEEGSKPIDRILDLHEINRSHNDLYVILMRTDYPMHAFKKFIDYGKSILISQMFTDTTLATEEVDWLADYIIGAGFSYSQRMLCASENVHRENLIHEFMQAGVDHFKKNSFPLRKCRHPYVLNACISPFCSKLPPIRLHFLFKSSDFHFRM